MASGGLYDPAQASTVPDNDPVRPSPVGNQHIRKEEDQPSPSINVGMP